MARIVLVDCFVDAAVEGEIVLIAVEASAAAEDPAAAGEFVDSSRDGEVVHGFHFAGADLEEGVFVPWRIKVDRLSGCHYC